MDTLEFMREFARMCRWFHETHEYCENCKLRNHGCSVAATEREEERHYILNVVEEWSKAHPKKTRQSEFLKMFPNAKMLPTGIPVCRPCEVDSTFEAGSNCACRCNDCRFYYWNQEVE